MKAESLRRRLDRERPMTPITIRMPEDVVDDLKALAPVLGFSGYQPLVRAYVGQGMRKDMKRLEGDRIAAIVDGLRRRGIAEDVIAQVLAEAGQSAAA